MSPLQPRRLDPLSPLSSTFAPIEPRAGILDKWLPGPNLNFTHGLDGVDQTGNYRWTEVLLLCFLIVALGTLALRICGMAHRHFRHMSAVGRPGNQNYWAVNQTTWWPWIQRHILTAPLFRKRHNRMFQWSSVVENGTLPGRWHTIVLFLYGASNLAYCLILPWHEDGVAAALRGRSGTLAALNLIPTVLFALRNNPLINLLQVSYDDFNLFHRWAARITIVESIVHMGAWIGTVLKDGTWKDVENALRVEESYTFGMLGTCCFAFILVQAWSPVRRAFYETFLNVHRLVVMFAIIGVWVHLEKHGLPQLPWLKLVVAMWILEWIFRLGKILYYGVSSKQVSRIRVEAMPGEACRLTIDLVRPWHVRPGSHVHMYMPRLALWSSHPFSVAWVRDTKPDTTPFSKESALPTLEATVVAPSAPRKANQINLICRARNGFTRKMYERASASPNLEFTTTGFIEGPYGGNHSLDSFGTVVLFAGGVGITHQCMYLQHLVAGHSTGTTLTRKVTLIWTIPDTDHLEWVRAWMDEVLRIPDRKKVLRIMCFISRPKRKLNPNYSETVKLIEGKPNIKTLIKAEADARQGAMAVVCCGGGGFADDVRAGTRAVMQDGVVEYIEEAFTY